MKQFLVLAVLVFQVVFLVAQEEQLNELGFNPVLYHSAKSAQSRHIHKYLIERGNIIVNTDTLTLPFVDDFSVNNLRSYKWLENHVDTAFYNVFGTCLGNEGITTIPGRFMTDTSWNYTFNVNTQTVDSTPKSPVSFTFFGIATSACFTAVPSLEERWPEYYTYTFDTLGRR